MNQTTRRDYPPTSRSLFNALPETRLVSASIRVMSPGPCDGDSSFRSYIVWEQIECRLPALVFSAHKLSDCGHIYPLGLLARCRQGIISERIVVG